MIAYQQSWSCGNDHAVIALEPARIVKIADQLIFQEKLLRDWIQRRPRLLAADFIVSIAVFVGQQ